MDLYFAYLRIVRKLLIQFDTVLLHYFLNIRLLQSMSESIVEIRVDQGYQLIMLQDDQ